MNTKVYKCCVVPQCRNTSVNTPSKLFVYVPHARNVRHKWLTLARRHPADITLKSKIYMCEDHFDLPQNMENYMEYYLMGSVSKVRMKPGCLPTKFDCQPDSKEGPFIAKKRRKIVIQECEKKLKKSSIVPQHSGAGHLQSQSGGILAKIKTEVPDDSQITWSIEGPSSGMELEDPLHLDDNLIQFEEIKLEPCNGSIMENEVYALDSSNKNPFFDAVNVANTDNLRVKLHRCVICDETFDAGNDYKIHLKTHEEALSVNANQEEEERVDGGVDRQPVRPPTVRRHKNPTEVLAGRETVKDAPSILTATMNSERIQEDDECNLHGKIIAKKLRKLPDNERTQFVSEIYNMFLRHEQRTPALFLPSVASPSSSPTYSNMECYVINCDV